MPANLQQDKLDAGKLFRELYTKHHLTLSYICRPLGRQQSFLKGDMSFKKPYISFWRTHISFRGTTRRDGASNSLCRSTVPVSLVLTASPCMLLIKEFSQHIDRLRKKMQNSFKNRLVSPVHIFLAVSIFYTDICSSAGCTYASIPVSTAQIDDFLFLPECTEQKTLNGHKMHFPQTQQDPLKIHACRRARDPSV